MKRLVRLSLAVAIASTAAACGGGGSGPDADLRPDAVPGSVRVSGVVRYEDRAPQPSGALAAPVPRAARFVTVALVNLAGDTLGASTTAEDGSFDFTSTVAVPFGDSVHVLVATMSGDSLRPVEVVRPDGNVHGFGDAGFPAEADHYTEVLITESSGEAGAFNVFDQLVYAVDYVSSLGLTPESLTAEWARNSQDGTYYGDFDNTMHLLGASSDDDGYDDTVILHEAGHWFEETTGRSDNPGGGHDGSPTDPNLAWSEGFSTYFSMAVNGGPIYVDSNAGGGWSYNADTSVTRAMGTGIGQDLSEDTVAEILWDLGDATADDDPFTGTHAPVTQVEPAYLLSASLRPVGEAGVDLIDFLDGFFLADGLSHCAAVDSIVTVTRTFPYDYNGPAGPCP